MQDKVLIQISFDTDKFMNYNFIFKLLNNLNLIENGKIIFNVWEEMEYKKAEIEEKLKYVNFKKHCTVLKTKNNNIEFEIFPTDVTSFSGLSIICSMNEKIINENIDILLNAFKHNFYILHVMDLKEQQKRKKFEKSLWFLKDKKYKILNWVFPIRNDINLGLNIGISNLMYFGQEILKFININQLLKINYVYSCVNTNNIVMLKLYENFKCNRDKKLERKLSNDLKMDELEKKIRNNKYMDYRYGQFFLKGYEKYQTCYFHNNYINETASDTKYIFPIFDFDLILKKYKKSYFEYIEEDFGSSEIIGLLIYKKENETIVFEKLENTLAYIIVELSDTSLCNEKYAKNVGYDTTIINSNQYFFERTQDNILEKINLFLTNYGFNYKISLYIRTDLLDSKITNKIIMEYDKLIKNSKLKKS